MTSNNDLHSGKLMHGWQKQGKDMHNDNDEALIVKELCSQEFG